MAATAWFVAVVLGVCVTGVWVLLEEGVMDRTWLAFAALLVCVVGAWVLLLWTVAR